MARRAVLFVFAAVLLGGCGGSSMPSAGVAAKSPDAILAVAKSAADGASSVHVKGSTKTGATAFDLQLVAGKGGMGQVSQNGLSFELVRIGNTSYIKGGAAFLRSIGGTTGAALLSDKWLKGPSSGADLASLSSLTDLRMLFDSLLASHGTLANGGTATAAGQPVVRVNDTSKGGALSVAARGTPYPIELSKVGASGGTIVFDRWNVPVTLAAPPNAIDVSQLKAAH